MWPTPTAGDAKASGNGPGAAAKGYHGTLTDATTRDVGGGWMRGHPDAMTPTDGDSGSPQADLNPRFVEALMGVPPNWLTPSTSVEMDSFRRWLHMHSLPSPSVPASTSGDTE